MLQVNIILQDIIQVKVVKRMMVYGYFKHTQLRIGYVDISFYGQEPLGEENLYVGCNGEGINIRDHYFNLKDPASGRFLTIQSTVDSDLYIDEIYVFQ